MRLESLSPDQLRAYLPTLLVLVLAAGTWFTHQRVLGVGGLCVALISFFFTRDLTGQVKKANEQKHRLDQQLIQSQKLASIRELSSGIAHEINNPLAIIGQEIEWVQHLMKNMPAAQTAKDAEELENSLEEIRRQVDRCREITHKLLDFARKKEPLIQELDINKLVEDMARLVEKEASHKDIKIVREYGENLPSVPADAPLMRQVVLNLLNNASYAIGRDGCIRVRTVMSGNDAVDVVVADTGCGIHEEDLTKIFDPFFTTKPQGKGTGLGLSICHGIVQKLGGQISVESKVGKGATFTVRLPLRPKRGET